MLRDYSSFDLIATANLTEGLFTSVNTIAGSITVSPGTGRRATQSLHLRAPVLDVANARRTFDAQTTWGLGFAYKINNVALITHDICAFRDGGIPQVDLVVLPDGRLQVTRNGTVLGTSTVAISSSTYYFLEFRAIIDNTGGAVKVRVNNAVVLNVTGIDTQATGNAFANEIMLGSARVLNTSGGDLITDIDDLHIYDGQAGAVTDCIGDCRVDALHPTADVAVQFTHSTGATNYGTVDESPPNGDTDYNESSTVGHLDRFTMEPVPALLTPTIYSVKINTYARNPQPGIRSLTGHVHSNSSTANGASHSLGGTYLMYGDLFETDPDTTAAWTQSGIDAASFGYTILS